MTTALARAMGSTKQMAKHYNPDEEAAAGKRKAAAPLTPVDFQLQRAGHAARYKPLGHAEVSELVKNEHADDILSKSDRPLQFFLGEMPRFRGGGQAEWTTVRRPLASTIHEQHWHDWV